jgi:hypothetical protein
MGQSSEADKNCHRIVTKTVNREEVEGVSVKTCLRLSYAPAMRYSKPYWYTKSNRIGDKCAL